MPSTINQEHKISNNTDKEFYSFMSYINGVETEKIEKVMKRYLIYVKQRDIELYESVLKSYNEFQYWGELSPDKGIYDVISNRAAALKNYHDNIIWLYNRLEDYRSKKCLLGIISHWLTFDSDKLKSIKDSMFRHYFDFDILYCDENEVFVDLGAYTGDTVLDYIASYDKYRKIYCYEIVPDTFNKLKNNLAKFSNIEFRQKGAHSNNGFMYLSGNEPHESMHKLSAASSEIKIPVTTIDEDIQEPVSFIKMDIEGGEQEALWGCKKHIQTYRPKLAVSVYHNNEDIWKCAKIINEITTGYKFYLRYYGENIYPAEYVLLAVHTENSLFAPTNSE